jgi:hypothetical protein
MPARLANAFSPTPDSKLRWRSIPSRKWRMRSTSRRWALRRCTGLSGTRVGLKGVGYGDCVRWRFGVGVLASLLSGLLAPTASAAVPLGGGGRRRRLMRRRMLSPPYTTSWQHLTIGR